MLLKKPILNQRGMSLIEVMIAAGLMGALAYMGMMLFEQQNKQARDIQVRFEMQDVLGQIKGLLYYSLSCQASFAEAKVDQKGAETAPSFLTEVVSYDKDKKKFNTKDRFHTTASQPDKKYGNNLIQIQKYELSDNNDPEVGINEETRTGSLYLNVYFDRGKGALGSEIIRKSLLLQIVLDSEKDKIVSCQSTESVTKSNGSQSIVIANPNENALLNNLSGDEACNKLGHTCVAVSSNNFVSETSGSDSSLGFVCSSSYNLKLKGIPDGQGKSQWHNCSAKLGTFPTFEFNSKDGRSSVSCSANFTALCQ